jgi:hypothetical protein
VRNALFPANLCRWFLPNTANKEMLLKDVYNTLERLQQETYSRQGRFYSREVEITR